VSPLHESVKAVDPATQGAPHPRRHGGRRLISTEVELKLAAPAAELQKLKCMLLAMPTAQSDVQADLVSIYYDTPDLALNRKRLTLRVRKQGRRFVQTVKAGDFAESDLLARREWEDVIGARDRILTHRTPASDCPIQSVSRVCVRSLRRRSRGGNRARAATVHSN
jgi:hypothetical protein